MASEKVAIDFVLRQEDATLKGHVTTLRGDKGGPTRFGLASNAHPELIAQGYFDETKVSRDAALAIAEKVYGAMYAAPLKIAGIADQAVATAVLSYGINSWIVRPAKFLQQACGLLHKPVEVDGKIGPGTLAVVNSLDPDQVLASFSALVEVYYRKLVIAEPQNAGDLHGWLNRVAAWTASAAALREEAKNASQG